MAWNLRTDSREAIIDALCAVEGQHFRALCERASNYSLAGAYRVLDKIDESSDWTDDNCFMTIYGDGGWNRYFVYGSGEIVFSIGHSNSYGCSKALTAGFRVH